METKDDYFEARVEKLKKLRELNINPYPYKYEVTHNSKQILLNYEDSLTAGDTTNDKVRVAGRIMLIRDMGKAKFMHIQDQEGKLQLYFRMDDLGKDLFNLLKYIDLGDFIGVEGTIFKTKKGEVTVYVLDFQLLSKSLRPLPEKYHGLKDTELRYRRRYLDLIMNPDIKVTFKLRSLIIKEIRDFLTMHGYLEMETPILQVQYGGANARPFITKINAWDMDMYLSISPELYLKRLLVGGYEKVFTICKNFRNEGVDRSHNPEFTMLEFYEAYKDYNDMMVFTEKMVEYVVKKIHGTTKIHYQGQAIDFKTPWQRLTMIDALKQLAGIDVTKLTDDELFDLRTTYNLEIEGKLSRGVMIQALFEELCESKLVQPVHIIDHPKESTPLCKPKRDNPDFVERFESYVGGVELTNGYSELNDPLLQRELLAEQARQLRAGFDEAHPMDEDFVRAVEHGMPPAGGVGIGIDRLVMFLTDHPSIRDVILFPIMKPRQK